MLRNIVRWMLQPIVEDLVDKRFKEKMYERYYESKQNDLQERIKRLRSTYFPPPTQRVQTETKREEEPSSVLEVSRTQEPQLRKTPTKNVKNNEDWFEDTMKEVEKARAKREEMDLLKAKLTGRK